MSDASTTQSVECPICGDEFDPTVAGGWCTNTECGEWQYTEATESTQADDGDDVVAGNETADDPVSTDDSAESTDGEPIDDDPSEPTAEADEAGVESVTGETPLEPETDADTAGDTAEAVGAVETEDGDAGEVDGLAAAEDTDDAAAQADAEVDETGEADDVAAQADAEVDETGEADDVAAQQDVAADETGEADDVAAQEDVAVDETEGTDDDAAADTIDCPDCGVELDADANFCLECGNDVSDVSPGGPLTACPSCDADVSPDDNFCVNCGEDLAAHREGTADDDDATDALDTLGSDDEPVPESLVLAVEGREIGVDDGEKVGREVRAALMDAGRPEEEAVRIHREHVRFVRETDSFYLLDLGDNPTRLNGRTLTKGDRKAVSPGDELELSGVATVEIRAP